ncbi:MAG: hypothetical protein QM703_00115 [Gemmatales bacterium]
MEEAKTPQTANIEQASACKGVIMAGLDHSSDNTAISRKVLAGIVVSLLALAAFRSCYIDSKVQMGNGWHGTSSLVIFGTHYHLTNDPTEKQMTDMHQMLSQSRLFIVGMWTVTMVVIVFWPVKKQAGPGEPFPSAKML